MALITRTKLYKTPPQTQRVTSPCSLQHPPDDMLQGTAIITASSINQASERERGAEPFDESAVSERRKCSTGEIYTFPFSVLNERNIYSLIIRFYRAFNYPFLLLTLMSLSDLWWLQFGFLPSPLCSLPLIPSSSVHFLVFFFVFPSLPLTHRMRVQPPWLPGSYHGNVLHY